jgi:hypothetical protein
MNIIITQIDINNETLSGCVVAVSYFFTNMFKIMGEKETPDE